MDDTNSFTYFNEVRKTEVCVVTSVDNVPENEQRRCYWCTMFITGEHVGCPIEYNPDTVYHKHVSVAKNSEYTVRTTKRSDVTLTDASDTCDKENMVMFGQFCTYSCALAYTYAHQHDHMFHNSETLLKTMYLRSGHKNTLLPSPHWTLLTAYGGPMTETDYRANLNSVLYENPNRIREIPVKMAHEKTIRI